MACVCIDEVNAHLANHNAALGITFSLRDGGRWPHLVVEKVDPKKRGRPPVMVPTFCPFCGVAYPDRIEAKAVVQ